MFIIEYNKYLFYTLIKKKEKGTMSTLFIYQKGSEQDDCRRKRAKNR